MSMRSVNLQCEHQEILTGLEQENKQLLQKVREINAGVSGLQRNVMECRMHCIPPLPSRRRRRLRLSRPSAI